jgi:hypothetical protein
MGVGPSRIGGRQVKITFHPSAEPTKTQVATLPYANAEYVEVTAPCGCGSVAIRGNGADRVSSEYDQEETAVCATCGAVRGRIRVEFATLFGITEDRRVLRGRCRVY